MNINKEIFIKLIGKYTEKSKNNKSYFDINGNNLIIKISSSCFNNCIFCPHKEEPFNIKIIDSLKKIDLSNIKDVFLIGEEPLYDEKILKILDILSNKNIHIMTSLNGVSRIFLNKLLSFNIKTISTSIYGPEKIHDEIVGNKGAFNAMMDNILYINNSGKKILLYSNSLIIKQNIDFLEEIIFLSKEYNLHINFMFPRLKSIVFNHNYILPFSEIIKSLNNFNHHILNIPICIGLNINKDYLKTISNNTYKDKLLEIYIDNTVLIKNENCKKCIFLKECKGFPIFIDKLFDNSKYIRPILSHK